MSSRFLSLWMGVFMLSVALGPMGPTAAREPVIQHAPSMTESIDVLEAEKAGAVVVKFTPDDSRSAQIAVRNRTDRPLTIRLPAAFAGVPVLAQMMGGGMGGGMGGMGGMGGGQAMGGGAMGGMGGGMGGGNVGFGCWVAREVYGLHDPRWVEFRGWLMADAPAWLRGTYLTHGEEFAAWIHDRPLAKAGVRACMDGVIQRDVAGRPVGGQFQVVREQTSAPFTFVVHPGRTRVFRFATVCLEHGKPEPSSRMSYRLVALDSWSTDPRIAFMMECLASGVVSQKAAQAATWHVANGLSWERLAAEKFDHAGGVPDEPFFTPADLVAARQAVASAERLTARIPVGAASGSSRSAAD